MSFYTKGSSLPAPDILFTRETLAKRAEGEKDDGGCSAISGMGSFFE
ncbi:MAG TPA: hypothetical protein VIR31_06475 [Nitrososphaeraceae archaeon]